MKMNLKKIVCLSLVTGMLATTAFANDLEVMPINANGDENITQATPYNQTMQRENYIVKEVLENVISVITTDDNKQEIVLNISNDTLIMDNKTGLPSNLSNIKSKEKITVYHSIAMTRSIPPQTSTYAVLTNIEENKTIGTYITVKTIENNNDGSVKVYSDDGMYAITIGKDTPIAPFKTRNIITNADIKEGTKLMAWFEIMTMSIPAFAGADKVIVIENKAVPTSIVVNSKTLNSKLPIKDNDVILVPIRAVAENLGFKVTWNADDQSCGIDNGIIKTTVYIGKDTYFMASSKAIGLSAPTSLGAKTSLVDGFTYVPAELFRLLLQDKININENDVNISFDIVK